MYGIANGIIGFPWEVPQVSLALAVKHEVLTIVIYRSLSQTQRWLETPRFQWNFMDGLELKWQSLHLEVALRPSFNQPHYLHSEVHPTLHTNSQPMRSLVGHIFVWHILSIFSYTHHCLRSYQVWSAYAHHPLALTTVSELYFREFLSCAIRRDCPLNCIHVQL